MSLSRNLIENNSQTPDWIELSGDHFHIIDDGNRIYILSADSPYRVESHRFFREYPLNIDEMQHIGYGSVVDVYKINNILVKVTKYGNPNASSKISINSERTHIEELNDGSLVQVDNSLARQLELFSKLRWAGFQVPEVYGLMLGAKTGRGNPDEPNIMIVQDMRPAGVNLQKFFDEGCDYLDYILSFPTGNGLNQQVATVLSGNLYNRDVSEFQQDLVNQYKYFLTSVTRRVPGIFDLIPQNILLTNVRTEFFHGVRRLQANFAIIDCSYVCNVEREALERHNGMYQPRLL